MMVLPAGARWEVTTLDLTFVEWPARFQWFSMKIRVSVKACPFGRDWSSARENSRDAKRTPFTGFFLFLATDAAPESVKVEGAVEERLLIAGA